jgi:hypothetical protein
MSANNSPNETTQGATLRVGDVLLGGMVVFKVSAGISLPYLNGLRKIPWLIDGALWMAQVEGTIFEVHRHRFTQYSQVFADMFLVPQAEGAHDIVDVEGRDKEHPIVLEGYQAADFAALAKILYPT